MRWVNYLKPNIKRGDFTEDMKYVDLMIRPASEAFGIGNRQVLISIGLSRPTYTVLKFMVK